MLPTLSIATTTGSEQACARTESWLAELDRAKWNPIDLDLTGAEANPATKGKRVAQIHASKYSTVKAAKSPE